MTKKQEAFIAMLKEPAIVCYKGFDILPSLTIAQAILESAWGERSIGNNIFGIKATDSWKCATKDVLTTEFYNGKYVKLTLKFRDYPTVEESILDHAKVLSQPRYSKVINSTNYKEACHQVQACGYATDPEYANKLISIIEKCNLNRWDMLFNNAHVAIDYLAEKSKINTPDYWKENINKVRHLDLLFIRWANDVSNSM